MIVRPGPVNPTKLQVNPGDVIIQCEGRDEMEVVASIAPSVVPCSRGNLSDREALDAVLTLVPIERPRAIGLVFDKEDGRLNVLDWLPKLFEKRGLGPIPDPGALIDIAIGGHSIRFGLFLNPPDSEAGALETCFRPQIDDHPLGPIVDAFVKASRPHRADASDVRDEKVRMRAYLAARNKDNTGLGVALREGTLSVATPEFEALRDWLSRLSA